MFSVEKKGRHAWFAAHSFAMAAALTFAAVSVFTAGTARAAAVTLCPNAALPGGFGGSVTSAVGPLDATCGVDSAVQLSIPASTDYGKLQFNSGMPGYPAGLTLGGLRGLSANVDFTSIGASQPYFLLAFTDGSKSLGQGNAGDQILFIEFQSSALSGNTLAVNLATTQFNLYDNTAGSYLQGGQSDTNSIDGWLALFPDLAAEALQGIWIGEGLDGTNAGPEKLTVNSLTVSTVPEPASASLLGVALIGCWMFARRRRGKASA